jgi:DNA-binding response OmpR family regulator
LTNVSVEARPRVLVVEDDPEVAVGIVRGLRNAGFDVELQTDGENARREVVRTKFDAVVLDLMLPERDGLQVLEHIRATSSVPVFVVSARSALESRLDAFSRGAVDFIPKPFWTDELVARLRLRLASSVVPLEAHVLQHGALLIDLDARKARIDGQPLNLTKAEFDLLVFLAERPGRAISRRELKRALPGVDADQRTIDSHVGRIRKKLGALGVQIETVWGIGYRLRPRSGEP